MKNKIVKWLEENGIYSPRLRSQIADNALRIAGSRKIDSGLFDSWINSLNLEGVMNIGSYFLKCFETELRSGRLENIPASASSSSPEAASAPQSVSEFEASWEDWKKLLNELDPDDGIPSKGVLCQDDNTNVVRAISDGDGGIVYIDGTLSERYPCFEDLDDEKKRDISNACIKLHRSAGYLERFKGLMEKIKPYETAS